MPSPVVDKKWVKGRIEKVACPHCKDRQDLRPFKADLEKTPKFECDKCGEYYEVVRVQPVLMVWLRKVDKPEDAPDPDAEAKDGDKDDGCSAPSASNQPT